MTFAYEMENPINLYKMTNISKLNIQNHFNS